MRIHKSILIFQDELAIASVMKAILTDEGYRVEFFLTTDSLLEKINDFKPDLILIGRKIPPFSGEQSVKIIKENCIIPIVFISGSATLEDMQNSGADAYISKPIDINKLLLIVKTFTNSN